MELGEVWDEYRLNPDVETKGRLTLQYAPLVKFVANRVGDGSAEEMEKGLVGLGAAIDGYDFDGRFEPYAMEMVAEAVAGDSFAWDVGWQELSA